MNKILNTIKEVPNWEKAVILTLVIMPIPFTMSTYFGVRTILKKMKNNTEIKRDEL